MSTYITRIICKQNLQVINQRMLRFPYSATRRVGQKIGNFFDCVGQKIGNFSDWGEAIFCYGKRIEFSNRTTWIFKNKHTTPERSKCEDCFVSAAMCRVLLRRLSITPKNQIIRICTVCCTLLLSTFVST